MNKWLYRAVGVASGALLLGGGVAHAGAVNQADRTVDPQTMRGLLADLFTPTGGQHHLGLNIDAPADRANSGTVAHWVIAAQPASNNIGFAARTPGDKDIFGTGMFPDLTKALPTADSFPNAAARKPELLPGLGLTSGAGGNGGLLGGLTGAAGGGSGLVGGLMGGGGGLPLVGDLFGGLTGGGGGLPLVGGLMGGGGKSGLLGGLTGGDMLGGLTGGLTGAEGPLGGLTGADGPLNGLTKGLADAGPLGPLTSGLTNAGPLSGLTGGLLGGQDDDVQFDDTDLSTLGTPGPASTDIVDPALSGTPLDTSGQRPVILNPDLARQVNDATSPMVQALIHDAMSQQFNQDMNQDMMGDPADQVESLPVIGGLPIVGDLLGPGGPLGQFLVVGDIFDKLPVVGDLTKGGLDLTTLDRLPVVSKVLSQGVLQSDGPSLPLVGSLPFVGKLTDPLLGGGANGASPLSALTSPLSALGGLTGGLTGGKSPLGGLTGAPAPVAQPVAHPVAQPVANPAMKPAPRPVAMPIGQPQAPHTGIQRAEAPQVTGKHRAPTDTVRPTVNDAEYAEEGLPLLGALTGGDGMGALPLSTLVRQLPLASELPLVGQLAAPMQILKSLPIVGGLVGILPIESGTAA